MSEFVAAGPVLVSFMVCLVLCNGGTLLYTTLSSTLRARFRRSPSLIQAQMRLAQSVVAICTVLCFTVLVSLLIRSSYTIPYVESVAPMYVQATTFVIYFCVFLLGLVPGSALYLWSSKLVELDDKKKEQVRRALRVDSAVRRRG